MDLFESQNSQDELPARPLADKMRPVTLDALVGQEHLTARGSLLRKAIEDDRVFSILLWGPPGCGKTTLAGIIARETRSAFIEISAVLSGVKEIRQIIEQAKKTGRCINGRPFCLWMKSIGLTRPSRMLFYTMWKKG